MGIYFRKRTRLFKGADINFSKRGASLSIGPRGAKLNISRRGVYGYASIPGTGIYVREKLSGNKGTSRRSVPQENVPTIPRRCPIAKFVGFTILTITPCLVFFTDLRWYWIPLSWIIALVFGLLIANLEDPDWEPGQPIAPEVDIDATGESGEISDISNDNVSYTHGSQVALSKDEIVIPPYEYHGDVQYDPLLADAVDFFISAGSVGSVFDLIKHFSIDYDRGRKICDYLRNIGVIGIQQSSHCKQILLNQAQFNRILGFIRANNPTTSEVLIEVAKALEETQEEHHAVILYGTLIFKHSSCNNDIFQRLTSLLHKQMDYEYEAGILIHAIELYDEGKMKCDVESYSKRLLTLLELIPEPQKYPYLKFINNRCMSLLEPRNIANIDDLFYSAAHFVVQYPTASIALLERQFSISRNRASRIMQQLEHAGIVSSGVFTKLRTVLVDTGKLDEFLKLVNPVSLQKEAKK